MHGKQDVATYVVPVDAGADEADDAEEAAEDLAHSFTVI